MLESYGIQGVSMMNDGDDMLVVQVSWTPLCAGSCKLASARRI